jgi:hypothetical protein
MNKTKLLESAQGFGKFALGFVRGGLGLVLWVIGLTMVVYVVRLPFYDDSAEEFLRNALLFCAVVMGMTLFYVTVFWLFTKSVIVRVLFAALFALSVVATCSSPFHCTESRYITCD